jgi:hypothetical protein
MPSLLAISIDNKESSQQQPEQQQMDSGRSEQLIFHPRQKTKIRQRYRLIHLLILFKKNRRRRRWKKLLHPTQSTYHPLFC